MWPSFYEKVTGMYKQLGKTKLHKNTFSSSMQVGKLFHYIISFHYKMQI